jgi:hypothetical protein
LYALFFGAINVAFIASQVFWIRRARELGKRLMPIAAQGLGPLSRIPASMRFSYGVQSVVGGAAWPIGVFSDGE